MNLDSRQTINKPPDRKKPPADESKEMVISETVELLYLTCEQYAEF